MVSNTELDSPINDFQQLMAITAEECGELTQSCMKIMRKFDSFDQLAGDPYTAQLVDELGDVQCMIELMIDHGIVGHKEIAQRAEFKREKLRTWSTLIEE